MQFDKGYISPYFVTDNERMEAVLDDPYILRQPGQDLVDQRPAAAAGEGRPGRQAAVHPRRGRRRRGALDARRQQDPRHVHRRRRQGPGVRRPPQGDAAGHRDAHRCAGRHGRCRAEARPGRPRGARHRPPRRRHQGRHDDRRRRRRRDRGRRPGSTRSRPRSRTPTPTGTARSSRSASPSWPAASASSRSARPPRSSSRRRSTASRTPYRRPVRRSRKASSPAAGPLSSTRRPSCPTGSAWPATSDRRPDRAPRRSTSRCAGSPRTAATEGYVVVAKVREAGRGQGFNAATGEYGDLVAQGVLDPVKVTRSALPTPPPSPRCCSRPRR